MPSERRGTLGFYGRVRAQVLEASSLPSETGSFPTLSCAFTQAVAYPPEQLPPPSSLLGARGALGSGQFYPPRPYLPSTSSPAHRPPVSSPFRSPASHFIHPENVVILQGVCLEEWVDKLRAESSTQNYGNVTSLPTLGPRSGGMSLA